MGVIHKILVSFSAFAIVILVASTNGASAHQMAFTAFDEASMTDASSSSCETDGWICNNSADKHSVPCHSSAAGHCVGVLIGPEARTVVARAPSHRTWALGNTDILSGLVHKQDSPPPRS